MSNAKNSREECSKVQVSFLILGKSQTYKSNNFIPGKFENYATFELAPYLVGNDRISDAIKNEIQGSVVGFQNYAVIGGKESVLLILLIILVGLYLDRNHLKNNVLRKL